MSILNQVTTGKKGRAQKVVIFTPEGFGKSTMASRFPGALFLDVEGSTSQMDVARLDRNALPTLKEIDAVLLEVAKTKGCSTLVIDTIDWLEQMVLDALIVEADNPKIQGVEDFGYGKGYTILRERVSILLARFDDVIRAGITVVLLSHSKVVKFEPPDGAGPYDRYELKLSRQVAPLIKEWADMLLFGNWRTQVREREKNESGAQFKGVGGRERLIHCNRTAAWDAKNRHGMPDVEKWDIAVIEKAFREVGAPWGDAPAAAVAEPAKLPKPAVALATPAKAEPVKTPAVDPADDQIPGIPLPVAEVAAPAPLAGLIAVCEPNAEQGAKVNLYLIESGRIKPGQTWRNTDLSYQHRVLKNPAQFLKIALNGKKVTA